jgi:predicted TIM-barrel fold metal-dependent hydrolase
MEDRKAWLDQVQEDIIEPDLTIIDPHHHLWLQDRPAPYALEDLWRDTGSGHNVEQTVFIECATEYRATGPEDAKSLGETEFVAEAATVSTRAPKGAARISAIIGFVDLTLGEAVEDLLIQHIEAGRGFFRGIRHAAGWDKSADVKNSHTTPPQGLYGREEFRQGLRKLGEMGLVCDAWNYHTQISDLAAAARACPDVTIIMDHFGGPLGIGPYTDKRAAVFTQWKQDFSELAQYENVVAKLGGMAMPVNGYEWHKRDKPATSDELVSAQSDYYMHAIDVFGPDRCMFESNFPVDKQSISYPVLWNAFKKMVVGFSATEKADLFSETARRVYRIE